MISSPGKLLDQFASEHPVTPHAIEMSRTITPFRDLITVWRIWRKLRRMRPTIIHAHTPKGGLLGMIGAWMARTPIRIYQIRGLPFLAATGNKRRLLQFTEFIACKLAHRVICNSTSNLEIATKTRICPAHKITILHKGSGNGVDATSMFNPDLVDNTRDTIRIQQSIPPEARVIGFVGRIVRDKGVNELMEAWQSLRADYPDVRLLLVGPPEVQNVVSPETQARLIEDDRIHLAGLVEDLANMPSLYAAMDMVVLPSYREGFPNVLLEAAAMALPVVSTFASGCVDAVSDGVTGTLVPVGNADALANAIRCYLDDPDLRRKHGQAGRERVLRDFRPEDIWQAQMAEYQRLMAERGLLVEQETDV